MPYIRLKEKKIYYQIREVENKNALIFIHGSGGNSNTWKNQFKLNVDYNLIAFDLPSHAKSDEFSELSLELYVNSLNALVDSLSLEKIILCGHSLGTAVAQSYYFRSPEKIQALIFIGGGARLRVSPVILDSIKNDFQAYLKSITIGAFYRKAAKKIIAEYIGEVSKIDSEVVYSDFSICNQFDELERVKSGGIRVPTLILCGNADKLTPIKYSQFFSDYIENSEFKIIRNAGHMVYLEKSDEINQSIKEFIQLKLKKNIINHEKNNSKKYN
ncbi:MAG: alpha/beta fold hydrolase [Promethearchaeota archaeon]